MDICGLNSFALCVGMIASHLLGALSKLFNDQLITLMYTTK